MIVPNVIRRARLQTLMARQLDNWCEAWSAYSSSAPMPPLRFRNGLVFHSGPGDSAGFLFFEIFVNGCYRRGLPSEPGGDVVDIGANIGAFTLDAASRYPAATVHVYEPDPQTCAVLRRNVEANGLSTRVRIGTKRWRVLRGRCDYGGARAASSRARTCRRPRAGNRAMCRP